MAEPATLPAERRGATRIDVRFPVTLARSGAATECEAENISVSGMLIRSSADLPVWAWFTAALPGERAREVRVVRRDGARYGCLFQTALTAEELDAVLESEEARAGFERLRAEAEAPPPEPRRKGLLRLWPKG